MCLHPGALTGLSAPWEKTNAQYSQSVRLSSELGALFTNRLEHASKDDQTQMLPGNQTSKTCYDNIVTTGCGRRAGSPCNLDHLGFIGLHVLQKGRHRLPCVNDGLRAKERAKHEIKIGRTLERRLRLIAPVAVELESFTTCTLYWTHAKACMTVSRIHEFW